MKEAAVKSEIMQKLQKEILSLQGYCVPTEIQRIDLGLGSITDSFPNKTFPLGAVHEFISTDMEHAAATTGFMSGLLSRLMDHGGACLWISTRRTVFPPALKSFGIEPDRVIFVDLTKEKDVLWAMEEALKCEALAAVVGETKEISLTESRRLQLAVEHSRVTGFLHRYNPRSVNTLACVSRWIITPVSSQLDDGMPGVGYPRWHVQLVKVRNGEPGEWLLQWSAGCFEHIIPEITSVSPVHFLKTG